MYRAEQFATLSTKSHEICQFLCMTEHFALLKLYFALGESYYLTPLPIEKKFEFFITQLRLKDFTRDCLYQRI